MAQRRLVLWLRVSDPQCSPGRNGLAWPPAPGRAAREGRAGGLSSAGGCRGQDVAFWSRHLMGTEEALAGHWV